MRKDQRRALGHFDGEAIASVVLVDQREQHERRAALGVPQRLDRRHLGRLVLERVQPVLIAGEDLQRHQHRGEARAEAQCLQRRDIVRRGEQAPRR